jgi:hypothetical protein
MSEDEISIFAKKATSLIHQRLREDGVARGSDVYAELGFHE